MSESKLVPIKWRALAAVPGESLNRRLYSKEILEDAAPGWVGKPFLLDHHTGDVDNRVVGIITNSK